MEPRRGPLAWVLAAHCEITAHFGFSHLAGLVLGGKVCVECLVQGKHLMTKWWLCPTDSPRCFSREGAVWGGGHPL